MKDPSDGTVTGQSPGDIEHGNDVDIVAHGGKTWHGSVGTQTADPLTWNATVHYTGARAGSPPGPPGCFPLGRLLRFFRFMIPVTVTVTVSNASGPSNPVDTTSDIP